MLFEQVNGFLRAPAQGQHLLEVAVCPMLLKEHIYYKSEERQGAEQQVTKSVDIELYLESHEAFDLGPEGDWQIPFP